MNSISQGPIRLPVIEECDVVVVGGGLSGTAAAIELSRKGMRTVLVSEQIYLGREAVTGCSVIFDQTDEVINSQIKDEILKEAAAIGAFKKGKLDSTALRIILNRTVTDASVKPFFNTRGTKALMDGRSAVGVVIANRSGRQAIRANLVVDATDGARIARSAGTEFQKRPEQVMLKRVFTVNNAALENTVIIRIARSIGVANDRVYIEPTLWPGELVVSFYLYIKGDYLTNTDFVSASTQSMRKVFEIMKYLKGNVPGFENAMLTSIGDEPLFLNGSRIIGDEFIDFKLAVTEHPVPPGIACAVTYTEEIHEETAMFYIPYGCLKPKGIKNLLVASPHISVDEVIQPFLIQFSNALCLGEGIGRYITAIMARNSPREGF